MHENALIALPAYVPHEFKRDTINVQRIGYRGRRMKKEQMMLQPSARK
jgi:hypothetical protein